MLYQRNQSDLFWCAGYDEKTSEDISAPLSVNLSRELHQTSSKTNAPTKPSPFGRLERASTGVLHTFISHPWIERVPLLELRIWSVPGGSGG